MRPSPAISSCCWCSFRIALGASSTRRLAKGGLRECFLSIGGGRLRQPAPLRPDRALLEPNLAASGTHQINDSCCLVFRHPCERACAGSARFVLRDSRSAASSG